MNDDLKLLRDFARDNSEAAFATLVSRHVNLVYSVALRSARDAHLAEEITQAVFIILARKADSLGDQTILPGWLCRTARYASANALTVQRRRQHREQEAYMQSILNESANEPIPEEIWNQIAPLLDGALDKLGQKDYDALVLRFFENKNFAEVGAALGASEDAAKMRVQRALEKLRKIFTKRGMVSTTTILAGAISANAVQAAPVGLAKAISVVVMAKGAAAGTSTLTLVKGALKIMAWTKMKTAVVVGAGVLLAAGTATVAVKEIQKHEDENLQWQTRENLNSVWLQKAPPLLKIVPTKFPNGGGGVGVGNPSGWKAIRLGYTVKDMLADAYGFQDTRTAITTPLPQDKYDFIVTVPSNARQLLQNGIKKQFGLAGRFEFVETNVLLLSVKNPKADGLKASSGEMIYEGNNPGHFAGTNQPLGVLSEMLEGRFRIPVVDQTGLTNRYDFNLAWDEYGKKVGFRYPDYPNLDGLKQSLLDQLGLELVPTNMPIEMLVIEKAK